MGIFDVSVISDNELRALRRDNDDQRSRLLSAQNTIEHLNVKIQELSDKLLSLQGIDSAFAIDYSKIKAFSIERSRDQSVIGYIGADGFVHEWYFACNMETHTRLVSEFKSYKTTEKNNGS